MGAADCGTLREALSQVRHRGTAKQHAERTDALDRMEAELKALREALWNAVPTLMAHAPDAILNQAQAALRAP